MLKKRLIGVITVKDGMAVQSIGYQRYLPLGKPWCIAENLDRWGVDEILILSIDRTKKNIGPDYELLSSLVKAKLTTPLIYGGGVFNKNDANKVIHAGADRICLDALLHEQPHTVREIADVLGVQAIIGALPLSKIGDSVQWYNYRTNKSYKFTNELIQLFSDGIISEVLIIDWKNEGRFNGFDYSIIENIDFNVPQIVFGGISEHSQMNKLLSYDSVAAISIGNFLSYQEHTVQKIKQSLSEQNLRSAVFELN